MEHLLILLFLLQMMLLPIILQMALVSADSPCLPSCSCSQRWYANDQNTFHLRCGRFMTMTQVPDWSGLQYVEGSIAISLYVNSLKRLRREDFPSDFPIVSIEINGNTVVEDDAFQNVRDTMQELEVSGLKLNLSRPLAFLADLPNLKRLSMEAFGEVDPEGHWTGSPFKDLGLDLIRLSIMDQDFTDIGPDVFEGVSAKSLVLEQNSLVWFPGQALRRIAGLKSVSMAENSIRLLEDGDTDGVRLEFLDLSDNLLEDIEPLALRGVKDTLVHLSLRGNRLDRIPVAAFSQLQRLKELDVSYNPVENIASGDFQGGFCLERLRLGGYLDEPHLRSIEGGAFRGHGPCLKALGLGNTALLDFPTAAIRELRPGAVVDLESEAITALKGGAFSGVGVEMITITAPLTAVHSGAFDHLKHYPLSLVLENTELTNASFFYEYPAGTFLNLHIFSYRMPCDCSLAGIRHNLQSHPVRLGGRLVTGNLTGVCRYGEDIVYLGKPEAEDIFAACGNFTILEARTPPPYVHFGSQATPRGGGSQGSPTDGGSPVLGSHSLVSFILLLLLTSLALI